MDQHDAGVPAGKCFNINVLSAIKIALRAWTSVKASTVVNCWGKAGILPSTSPEPVLRPALSIHNLIDQDGSNLQGLLDELLSLRLVDSPMSVSALVNSTEEHNLTDTNWTQELVWEEVMAHSEGKQLEIEDTEEVQAVIPTLPSLSDLQGSFKTVHQAIEALNHAHPSLTWPGRLQDDLGRLIRAVRSAEMERSTQTTLKSYFTASNLPN